MNLIFSKALPLEALLSGYSVSFDLRKHTCLPYRLELSCAQSPKSPSKGQEWSIMHL